MTSMFHYFLPCMCVVSIPVPWGHIAGKSWGEEVSERKILCIHGEHRTARAGVVKDERTGSMQW